MIDIVKYIMEIFEKYGIKGGFFIAVIFGIIGMLRSEWFGKFLSKVTETFIEKFMKGKLKNQNIRNITESDITNHDIFNYIDYWVNSKIPTKQFSTDYRTAVFRKYISIYLKTYKLKIGEFVNDKTFQAMDESKLWKALLDLINQIVSEYERLMVDAEIPKIVIEKMKIRNNDVIELTIDLIEGICGSQFYETENNLLKVYSILNILLSVLENTLSNSEGVCNSINGKLKGLKFEGNVEP